MQKRERVDRMGTKTGLHLICVDDECSSLVNYEYMIKDIPDILSVDYFQSPKEALTYANSHQVDMAFLDIDLPEMSGFELSAQLKELCPSVAVAFVTGNISYMSVSRRPVKAPFLFKPYSRGEMLSALDCMRM